MTGSIRKRGDQWYYSFELAKVNGKRKRIERVGGATKREAEKALRAALMDLDATGHYHEPSDLSFSDYLDQWMRDYVKINLKYNTQLSYQKIIENHLRPALGFYKLKNLSPHQLQEFINSKKIAGYKKSTAALILNVLSRALKYAVQPCGFLKTDPSQYVKLPKFNNYHDEIKTLTNEQFQALLAAFPRGTKFHFPLLLGYYTGMRIGECLALTWEHINFIDKTIKIRQTMIDKKDHLIPEIPKTKASIRDILYGKTLETILKDHKKWQKENQLRYGKAYKINQYVCTDSYGNNVNFNHIRYLSIYCKKKLGFKFNFHMLRHTHATLLIANGADLKDVSRRLGHANLATTADIYAHVTKQMQNKTVSILENLSS